MSDRARQLPRPDDVAYLADAWFELCGRHQVEPEVAIRLLADLLVRYSESGRSYHDLRHIRECLEVLDENADMAEDLDALRWAIFFHDVVYDTHVADETNVAASADLAVSAAEEAGLPHGLALGARRLVMATTHSEEFLDTVDERLIADVDLAVLAWPWEVFCEYGDRIREEYVWASDEDYRKGRAVFFERMLAAPRLYLTDRFRDRYEKKVRANMRRGLDQILASS